MTFYIEKVKGQFHCDITLFCHNRFLAIIKNHYSTEEKIVSIFHN